MKLTLLKSLVFVVIFSFSSNLIKAQEILPHNMTQEELKMLPLPKRNNSEARNILLTPPTLPVRTAAEWEEVQTLLMTWTGFPSILAQIADAAQEECEVLITCSDSNQVRNYLLGQGIPLNNIKFLVTGLNSIWQRDYSAHTAYLNDVDSLVMVEWIYNRPRPMDDIMPVAQMNYKGVPLYSLTEAPNDLVNTGGNWMVDGFGTAFASKLVLDENIVGNQYGVTPKSEADIDTIVKRFQGINRYIKMETLPYDAIHHIDMHMKLIDEETLLVGEYPQGISDGPQIEANLQYVLSNFNSVFGTPYKVIRIPMPPSTSGANPGSPFGSGSYRTYTNSVFINKTVLVPFYRQEYDTTAMRIYTNALPGYKIIGIDCDNSGSNIIAQSGAIHCITNSIGVYNPLLISHQALPNTANTSTDYQVNALIQHRSGIANAYLYYSTDTALGYQQVAMSLSNASTNTWTGFIPAQQAGTTVFYYIEATAFSGKHQVRPIAAPQGFWKFQITPLTNSKYVANRTILQDIYPNPANAITCVPIDHSGTGNIRIAMYDVTGRFVHLIYEGEMFEGKNNFFINSAQFDAGIYNVVYETTDHKYTRKLCIKK